MVVDHEALVLLEEFTPVIAAFVATVVLARQGFNRRIEDYRRDTMALLQTRADHLDKELATARAENEELQREAQRRERRIRALEEEIDELRSGTSPPRKRRRTADDEDSSAPRTPRP